MPGYREVKIKMDGTKWMWWMRNLLESEMIANLFQGEVPFCERSNKNSKGRNSPQENDERGIRYHEFGFRTQLRYETTSTSEKATCRWYWRPQAWIRWPRHSMWDMSNVSVTFWGSRVNTVKFLHPSPSFCVSQWFLMLTVSQNQLWNSFNIHQMQRRENCFKISQENKDKGPTTVGYWGHLVLVLKEKCFLSSVTNLQDLV